VVLTLVDLARLMSQETAKFAGLDSIKRRKLKVGNHADFCVFDENIEYTITH